MECKGHVQSICDQWTVWRQHWRRDVPTVTVYKLYDSPARGRQILPHALIRHPGVSDNPDQTSHYHISGYNMRDSSVIRNVCCNTVKGKHCDELLNRNEANLGPTSWKSNCFTRSGNVLFCTFCFHRANWRSSATLTEGFPCFFLNCKANAGV